VQLVVISHKLCWRSTQSPTGYATDGGFALQMAALAELFDATRIVVPCAASGSRAGEVPLGGRGVEVVPLTPLLARDLARKVRFPGWLARNAPRLVHEVVRADAAHTPIPGDVGTIGMLLALLARKRLFVRHCGNWLAPATTAERLWVWSMERLAGGRNVMLATGGAKTSPSARNLATQWIFSTTLREDELRALRQLRHAPPSGSGRLIIVCRQDVQKGAGVVIESLPEIWRVRPHVRLDVVGDGPDLQAFRTTATRLGVADRVTFHGALDHDGVLRLLQQADLFCYPTRASEGFPKVVLEALACGLPVIATPVSVLPELLQGGCGIVIGEASPASVARAVIQCLADPAAYERSSLAALRTAQQYSLERWRDTLGEILRAAWGPLQARA
jgi:hypothetical protein